MWGKTTGYLQNPIGKRTNRPSHLWSPGVGIFLTPVATSSLKSYQRLALSRAQLLKTSIPGSPRRPGLLSTSIAPSQGLGHFCGFSGRFLRFLICSFPEDLQKPEISRNLQGKETTDQSQTSCKGPKLNRQGFCTSKCQTSPHRAMSID